MATFDQQMHAAAASASATSGGGSHPFGGARGLIWFATWVCAMAFDLVRIYRRREGATVRDRGSHRVFSVALPVIFAVLLAVPKALPGADIRPDSLAFAAGEAVFLLGFAVRGWAILTLGTYFTATVMTSPDQPVITSAPYRVLRHPSYTGLLLYIIGIGLIWDNWISLAAATVLMSIPLVYRIRVEEKALLEDLGDPYRAFASRRKRLIPFVW
ncbi:MAG TPA: isoprenylcysteine carboxylmethyltransferase family protein [Actinocrinis sp.]|nr:isoprenylcysteine carboxylmethyltransferase family protein [Actinocrinis sp.]